MKEKGKGSLRNRLRRSISLLIAAVMIFTMIPINGLLQSAYATVFSGSGTEKDPYLIEDLADLEYLSESVNGGVTYEGKYFKLTNDIDMTTKYKESSASSWTPIGLYYGQTDKEDMPFEGSFDGDGHIITLYLKANESYSYYGLFGYVGTSGTVKNLGVDGEVYSEVRYAAGIVAFNKGNLENCYNKGKITASFFAGGLVANNHGTIKNCYNEGSVSGHTAGGVVEYNSGTIEYCWNNGNVNATGTSGSQFSGGISSHMFGGYIKNCYNIGAVSGTNNVGGICGYIANVRPIENCYNIGTVSGDNYVGGISGNISGGAVIKNCYNTGNISASSASSAVAGGVIGYVTNANSFTIANCYNIGTVSAENCSSPKIGGILGQNENLKTTISGCYYDNTVCTTPSDNSISGIAGKSTDDFKTKSVFAGWDFDTLWGMSDDRPVLRSVEEYGKHIMHSMSTDCSEADAEPLLAFQPLTKDVLESMLSDDNNYYVIDSGNYYLAEDITLEHEIQIKDKKVNLCLNGHTINRSSGNAISVSGKSELNICDCGGRGEIIISKSGSAIKVAQDTEADTGYGSRYRIKNIKYLWRNDNRKKLWQIIYRWCCLCG